MRILSVLCVMCCLALPALAAVQTFVLHPTASGEVFDIDLGSPVDGVVSCSLQCLGESQSAIWVCDSMSGQQIYEWGHMLIAAFVDSNQEADCECQVALQGLFDVTTEMTADDWSFLTTDGVTGFSVLFGNPPYPGGPGYCHFQDPGALYFQALILTVETSGGVPVQPSNWSTLKSLYR